MSVEVTPAPEADASVAAFKLAIQRAAEEAIGHLEATKVAAAAAAEAQSKIAAVVTFALVAQTQIADEQAVIATKSSHIQQAQTHADKVRGDLDRALTAATQQATEAEGMASRAQTSADAIVQLQAEISAIKETMQEELARAVKEREAATVASGVAKKLADKAAQVEERLAKYENQLADFEAQAKQQLATIVGLLPGATSAGLAHAFDARRQTFLTPGKRWQWLFVGSVFMLVLLAASGLWHALHSTSALSYDDLLRLWIARLPIAAALIWLALHASRESALAKRLEEDYGYKSAVASSFQGFHKQMTEVAATGAENSALVKLCEDTLATIAAPPGRIYDKHQLTVTPSGELTESAKTVLSDVLKRFGGKSI